jgi:hypothetical protein
MRFTGEIDTPYFYLISMNPNIVEQLYSAGCLLRKDGLNRDEFIHTYGWILETAERNGLSGSVEEIHKAVCIAREAIQNIERKGRLHAMLVEGLKVKYKQPIDWFDTTYGSTTIPTQPDYITPEAFTEMTQLYPDYEEHIQRVKEALAEFSLPTGITRYSRKGEAHLNAFLMARGLASKIEPGRPAV